AELQRIEDEGDKRRPARDDLVTRLERRLAEVADHPVRSRADGCLFEAHAVQLRQAGTQPVTASVRVAVEVRDAGAKHLERCWKRAEWAFVRRELDDPLETELALHLLDRLARLVRDERCQRLSQKSRRDLAGEAHPGAPFSCADRFAHTAARPAR